MKNIVIIIVAAYLVALLISCNRSKKNPQNALELLCEAYDNNNWDKVIAIGDTLIGEEDPKNISIMYAEALAARGNIEKSINVLNRKIANNPNDYYLFQTKGNIFYVAEQYDSALLYYDKVIELGPAYARPYVYEGEIYTIIGKEQKAIERYLEAVRLFAANDFIDETEYFCNRILNLDSTNVEAKNYLEQVHTSQE